MYQIYVVMEGGCVRYVSSDSGYVLQNVGVTLIDLDTTELSPENAEDLINAEKLVRIY